MENTKLKNMIVLKNLPSNLVEEAIVIFKSNKKAKKLEKIERSKEVENINQEQKDNKYILKEAEMLISQYITNLEHKNENINNKIIQNRNYKRLKNYAFMTTLIAVMQAVLLIIK